MYREIVDFCRQFLRTGGHWRVDQLCQILAELERHRELPSAWNRPSDATNALRPLKNPSKHLRSACVRWRLENLVDVPQFAKGGVGPWLDHLLTLARKHGVFEEADGPRIAAIERIQSRIAKVIQKSLEKRPIVAKLQGIPAPNVLRNILGQATTKGWPLETAVCLVAAHFENTMPQEFTVPGSIQFGRLGCKKRLPHHVFRSRNAVFRIDMNRPTRNALFEIQRAAEGSRSSWILVSPENADDWRVGIRSELGDIAQCVDISSVSDFVGHSLWLRTESTRSNAAAELSLLFERYNSICARNGLPSGLRINAVS